MDCHVLRKRYEALDSEASNIKEVWERIEKYVVPFRGNFYTSTQTDENGKTWHRQEIFDDTAIQAAQTLSASIHGNTTSMVTIWFDLRFRNEELNKQPEAIGWLQEVRNRTYYALQESNFDLEASELYLDIVSFGTSVMLHEVDGSYEDYKGMEFAVLPVDSCRFEEDHKKGIIRFYRLLEWTATQIFSKFGEEVKSKIPQELLTSMMSPEAVGKKYKVMFAVYREPKNINNDLSKPLAPALRPYPYKYFLYDSCTELSSGGYYEMPAYIVRFRKAAGSKWGYSPAFTTLPTILVLNKLVELIEASAEKVIDPAIMVQDRNVIGDLHLDSAGVTVVRDIDKVRPFESAARFDVSQLERTELQRMINQAFFVDQLELKESPAMTATEVQVRYELMQRLLGPTLGRLQHDFLKPMIRRTINMLDRAGQLPPPPNSVIMSDGEFELEYVGPLARSQKLDVIATIERWIANVSALSQTFPGATDIPNVDEIIRETANLLSVPAKLIRSQEEVNSTRQERQEKEEEMRQAELAAQAGQAMSGIGKGLKDVNQGQSEGIK